MSAPTDHELIVELRGLSDLDLPEMVLDGPAVRAAGRRRANTRRWLAVGAGVTAVAAAAVLVVGAPRMLAARPALAPAAQPSSVADDPVPADEPAPADETVRTLATGVTAATGVTGGSSPWGTGLTVTLPTETVGLGLLTGTAADLQAAFDGTGVRVDHSLRVTIAGADVPAGFAQIAWADEQLEPDWDARASDPSALTIHRVGVDDTPASRIMVGVVPSWFPDAHIVLFSSEGMTDPSGNLVHSIEVPTFADPGGSGARMYMVVADSRAPQGQGQLRGIVYVAPDGSFVDADGSCALEPDGCTGQRVNGLDVTTELLTAIAP